MLISLRNKKQELIVKDMLDIDFDMSIKEMDGKYYVKINRSYFLDGEFIDRPSAERAMLGIVESRNAQEQELYTYC